jgi:hypothetical protein
MRYVRLGHAGPTISVIGVGAWAAGGDWGPVDEKAAIAAIFRAAELGSTGLTRRPRMASVIRSASLRVPSASFQTISNRWSLRSVHAYGTTAVAYTDP